MCFCIYLSLFLYSHTRNIMYTFYFHSTLHIYDHIFFLQHIICMYNNFDKGENKLFIWEGG